MSLDRFDLGERLWYDADRLVVYSATLRQEDKPVLLVMPVEEAPLSSVLEGLRRNYEISRHLTSTRAVLKPIALDLHGSSSVLVLEHFPGRPLSLLLEEPLTPITLCRIALSLCEALEAVHQAGLLHLDLQPVNVVVDIPTCEVRLTGFNSEGSLPYMSPEQTGRIGRSVDIRSDLYSLGCTLYAMATGAPPFPGHDHLSLVHSHLAIQPTPPSGLPKTLADLVLKLLAKEPSQRYQSARGVRQDLNLILNALSQGDDLGGTFRLGRQDSRSRLSLSSRLYGREAEIAAVVGLIRSSGSAGLRMVMVSGDAGLGKTRLLSEALRRTNDMRYLLMNGKWDQVGRRQPYSGICSAFSEAARKLLTESRDELESQRSRLREALGPMVGVLAQVVPTLDRLLGSPTSPMPPVAATEEDLHTAFRTFLQTVARADRPLVLFMDDLEWSDPASIRLLSEILEDPEIDHLTLLGAWRGSKFGEDVGQEFLAGLSPQAQARIRPLVLTPLTRDQVTELLVDSLQQDTEQTQQLAFWVHSQTQGHPLRCHQLLLSLVARRLIRHEEGRWVWNLQQIFQEVDGEGTAQGRLSPPPVTGGPNPIEAEQTPRAVPGKFHLEAAIKARKAAHFPQAKDQIEAGLACLSRATPGSLAEPDLTFAFLLERVWLAAQLDAPEEVDRASRAAWLEASTALQRVAVLEARLHLHANRRQWSRVLDLGLQALELLGEPLPANPTRMSSVAALGRLEFRMRQIGVEQLRRLPLLTNPKIQAVMGILRSVSSAAYFSQPNLYPLLVGRMISLSLQHGNCADSAFGYAGYGLVQSVIFGRFQKGYDLGRLALELVEQLEAPQLQGRVNLLFHGFLRPWKEAFSASIDALSQAATLAKDQADSEYWGYSLLWSTLFRFFSGQPLDAVRAQIQQDLQSVEGQSPDKRSLFWALQHVVQDLSGDPHETFVSEDTFRFPGTPPEEVHLTAAFSQGHQAMCSYLLGDAQGCVERMNLCRTYLHRLQARTCLPALSFYEALALLATSEQSGARRHALNRAQRVASTLRNWATSCPSNYLNKLRLVEAEIARVRGKPYETVMALYQESIRLARAQGLWHEEGLAQELAGRYAGAFGFEGASRSHLSEAVLLYLQWGAKAVAQRLVRDFPELDPVLTRTNPAPRADNIDVETIVSAAQALSQERVLDRLLETLTRLLLQNSGAERAVLVLSEDGGHRVQAEASRAHTQVRQAEPLEGSRRLCPSVVEFVLRSGESVVLEDALKEGDFQHDAYLRSRQVRSVLCAPLVHRGQIAGALYLENSQAGRVFTPDRIKVVQVLASQAAISLENVYHFQRLERQHDEILREREARHLEELRAKELAARKDTLAGFLGIAAHDLRNSLLAIELWTGQLGGEHLGKPVQRAKGLIEEACTHAHSLIRSYLDASQLEVAGHLVLRRANFAMDDLAREALGVALRSLTDDRRQQVTVTDLMQPLEYWGDRDRLMQVLANLIGNALLYCPGEMTLTLELVRRDNVLRLDLRDNGPGVTPQQTVDLFEPFRRASTAGDGRGLGLWICKVIVEAHQGQIAVESCAEGGHFWFELPYPDLGSDAAG